MWRKKAYEFFWKVVPDFIKLRMIARRVRAGKVPVGVDEETIFRALRETRGNHMEAFGFLKCKVFDKHGKLKQDYGLVGVKEVTVEFTKHLADALTSLRFCWPSFSCGWAGRKGPRQ